MKEEIEYQHCYLEGCQGPEWCHCERDCFACQKTREKDKKDSISKLKELK